MVLADFTGFDAERGFCPEYTGGIDLFQIESTSVWFASFFALSAVLFLLYLRRLNGRRQSRMVDSGLSNVPRRDANWISIEIERLIAGVDLNEALIKQMSSEERALFEVSIIDALNEGNREGQHRLRSALIKYGYDEQCSRRVMSENLSDRIRATALLTLLRPQWRDTRDDNELGEPVDESRRARAAKRSTGPLDLSEK